MTIILLRLNLDIEDENPENNLRFKLAVESIKKLSKDSNKIVILSHLGRPKKFDKNLSLKQFQLPLTKTLKKRIIFLQDFNFKDTKKEIEKAPGGSIILLENLRFLPGEAKNSSRLSKNLANLGDKFINDDFATSHRVNASTVGIIRFLPAKPGPLLVREVKILSKVLRNPKKPFTLIIGGDKMSDKIGVIKNLISKVDYVLLGGGPANTFLKAKGESIGKSIFDDEMLIKAKKLLKNKKVIIPKDSKICKNKILDIGSETLREYSQIIKSAQMIVWGGPMGLFEKPQFSGGTKAIWKAVLKNKKAVIVIGGGETIASLELLNTSVKGGSALARLASQREAGRSGGKNYKLPTNVFLSTGGGAMLEFLSGKKLPALVALKLQK